MIITVLDSTFVGNVCCNCRFNQASGFYYQFVLLEGTMGCQIMCANRTHHTVGPVSITTFKLL